MMWGVQGNLPAEGDHANVGRAAEGAICPLAARLYAEYSMMRRSRSTYVHVSADTC